MEDLPQLVLGSLYVRYIEPNSTTALVSIAGSAIMILKGTLGDLVQTARLLYRRGVFDDDDELERLTQIAEQRKAGKERKGQLPEAAAPEPPPQHAHMARDGSLVRAGEGQHVFFEGRRSDPDPFLCVGVPHAPCDVEHDCSLCVPVSAAFFCGAGQGCVPGRRSYQDALVYLCAISPPQPLWTQAHGVSPGLTCYSNPAAE